MRLSEEVREGEVRLFDGDEDNDIDENIDKYVINDGDEDKYNDSDANKDVHWGLKIQIIPHMPHYFIKITYVKKIINRMNK